MRIRFRARAGIEPIIGHLKQDHRMSRILPSGRARRFDNTLLAAAVFNLRKMRQRLKAAALNIFVQLFWRRFVMIWIQRFAV